MRPPSALSVTRCSPTPLKACCLCTQKASRGACIKSTCVKKTDAVRTVLPPQHFLEGCGKRAPRSHYYRPTTVRDTTPHLHRIPPNHLSVVANVFPPTGITTLAKFH